MAQNITQNIIVEGLISAGDSFPVRLIDANITRDLKKILTGSIFEHLAVARDLDIKKYKLFISVIPVQNIGKFIFNDTFFLGKIFADEDILPDSCDILLKRHELGVAAYWNDTLENLYNRVIMYKGFYFDDSILNSLATGREFSVEDYINRIGLNANHNAVTRWLGDDK